ncbi:MAG TPA: hypothetical protein VIV82_13340 [Verrucomicrobiae bacterium]
MKQHSKLSSEQHQEHISEQQSGQRTVQEFATAEELLRFDAASIPVPSTIAERLAKSSADIPKPNRSWWKRLFDH